MKFREDLIKDFVKSKNRHITEMNSYLSGTGATVTKVYMANSEKWVFINFDHLEIIGIGARNTEYRRPSQSKNYFRDWQLYVVDHTFGCQKDSLLGLFIKSSRNSFEGMLEDLCDCNDMKKIETFGDEDIKHVLKLEEKKFAYNLDTSKSEFDYNVMREGLRINKAHYGKMIHEYIDYLLVNVPKGFNEKGEEVYNFSETQYACYERLKEIGGIIEFSINYQIYRVDQKEDMNEFE